MKPKKPKKQVNPVAGTAKIYCLDGTCIVGKIKPGHPYMSMEIEAFEGSPLYDKMSTCKPGDVLGIAMVPRTADDRPGEKTLSE